MTLSIIAGIGKKNELGKDNQLLWNIPEDMRHFREITSGHPVIMGRKTFESIGKPLPNRRNIVITRDTSYAGDDIEVVHSLEEALSLFTNSEDEVFVIGGAEIYRQAIPRADKLYITHVEQEFPDADTFFPEIDMNIWEKISLTHTSDKKHNLSYKFTIYKKK